MYLGRDGSLVLFVKKTFLHYHLLYTLHYMYYGVAYIVYDIKCSYYFLFNIAPYLGMAHTSVPLYI